MSLMRKFLLKGASGARALAEVPTREEYVEGPDTVWPIYFLEDWGYGEPPDMNQLFKEDWQYIDPIWLHILFSEDWGFGSIDLYIRFYENWCS